jgi:hypothetical protein
LETETKITLKTEGTMIGKLNKEMKEMSDIEGGEPMKTQENIVIPQVTSRLKPNSENLILFLSKINLAEANPKKNETTPNMPIAK